MWSIKKTALGYSVRNHVAVWIISAVLYGFTMKKQGSERACVTMSG